VYRMDENRHLMALLDVSSTGARNEDFFASCLQLKEDFLSTFESGEKDWNRIMIQFDEECKKYPEAFTRSCGMLVTDIDKDHIDVCNLGSARAVLGVVPSQEYIRLCEPSQDENDEKLDETFIPRSEGIRSVEINQQHTLSNKKELELFRSEYERITGTPLDAEMLKDGLVQRLSKTTRSIGGYLLKGYDNTQSNDAKITPELSNALLKAKDEYNFREGTPIISALPEVSRINLHSNMRFMIVASESFWNLMSPQAAVDYVYNQLYAPLSDMPTDTELKFRMSQNSINTNLVARALVEPLVQRGADPLQALQTVFSRKDRSEFQSSDMTVSIAFFNPTYRGDGLNPSDGELEVSAQVDYDVENPIHVVDYRAQHAQSQL